MSKSFFMHNFSPLNPPFPKGNLSRHQFDTRSSLSFVKDERYNAQEGEDY